METSYVIPEYVSKLLSSSLQGYSSIVKELASMLNTTVILTNSLFEKIYITSQKENIQIDYLEAFCPIGSEEFALKRCFFKVEQQECIGICYPIKVNNVVKNYLVVVCEDTFIDTAIRFSEIIMFTGNLLELEFQKNETIILEKKKLKDIFIYDLIYGNIKKTEEIITYGQLWNWNFNSAHIVATFSLKGFDFYSEDPKNIELIDYAITKILEENSRNAITLVKRNEVVLIYLLDSNNNEMKNFELYISNIKNYLKKYSFYQRMCIGVGKKREQAVEIFRTYQEAKIAYELGDILQLSIAKFDSLGLEKILFNHDTQELREFFEQILGKLLIEDEITNSGLMATLEGFVSNQYDINKTAEDMFIHKNTLRYRIKKIEELLDIKFSDMDVKLNISAALKIKQLGKLK